MITLAISAASHALLSARAERGFIYQVRKNADGQFVIDVDEEVAAGLASIDPDPDKAIHVLCTTGVGRA